MYERHEDAEEQHHGKHHRDQVGPALEQIELPWFFHTLRPYSILPQFAANDLPRPVARLADSR